MALITPNHHPIDEYLTCFDDIPNTFGIYVFYRENRPVYIGKSIQLRQRIISHFQQSAKDVKEHKIIQQSTHIGWQLCAGEYSALLKEAQLVKQYLPIFNRRLRRQKSLHTIRLCEDNGGYLVPKPNPIITEKLSQIDVYGPFKNQRHRLKAMEKLLIEHQLCAIKLGLEFGQACFNHQIGRCLGACTGAEPSDAYNERLLSALVHYRQQRWSYNGPVYCTEYNPDYDILSHHHIDQWRHVESITYHQGTYSRSPGSSYDLDSYHLLLGFVKACPPQTKCPYPVSID